MPAKTLMSLLKANGQTGQSGQSFDGVSGSVAGTKMTDYRMTDWSKFSTGSVSETSTTASVAAVVSLTRGAKATEIQNQTSSSWAVTLSQNTEGKTAFITNYTSTPSGYPDGSKNGFTVNVDRSSTGDPGIVTGTGVSQFAPLFSGGTNNYTVQFSATVTGGGSGTYQVRIGVQWRPDNNANSGYTDNFFNPPYPPNEEAFIPFNAGRPSYISDNLDYLFNVSYKPFTSSDVDFQWFTTETDRTNGTNVFSTASSAQFSLTLTAGSSATRYMRFRNKVGPGAWQNRQFVYSRLGNGTWPYYGDIYVG